MSELDVTVPVYPRGMRIGELARRAGVTTRTVRYYEGLGLLTSKRVDGGHRQYDEEAVRRLDKIDWLKRMGFTLEEIAEVIPLYFGEQTARRGRKKMLAVLEQRLAETDERIEGLAAHREELRGAIERQRQQLGSHLART
jgi:MerR family transcriptional regulator, copper efflux regulator